MVDFSILNDHNRVSLAQAATLIGSRTQQELDLLTKLARQQLGTHVVLVSLVDDMQQCFIGQSGLAEPYASLRVTPLRESFCKHIVATDQPFVIDDAVNDPRTLEHPAISSLGVKAYAGVPIAGPNSTMLGSFCAIEHKARSWTPEELQILHDFATLANGILTSHLDEIWARASREEVLRLQRLQSLGQLVGSVSHDFSNVLQVVQGNSEIAALNVAESSEIKPYLENIQTASTIGIKITERLLTFCRQADLAHKNCDIVASTENCLPILQQICGPRIKLKIQLPKQPLSVPLGSGDIDLILMNLIGNAEKALEDIHSPRICLTISKTITEQGPRVALEVQDNGCGMSKDFAERISEPFFSSRREKGTGTGLGLATVYSIVRSCDGDIEVVSEPGEGTSFTISIPFLE